MVSHKQHKNVMEPSLQKHPSCAVLFGKYPGKQKHPCNLVLSHKTPHLAESPQVMFPFSQRSSKYHKRLFTSHTIYLNIL